MQREASVQNQRTDRPGQVTVGGACLCRVGQHRGELSAAQRPDGALRPFPLLERMRVGHATLPERGVFPGPITVQTCAFGLEAHCIR